MINFIFFFGFNKMAVLSSDSLLISSRSSAIIYYDISKKIIEKSIIDISLENMILFSDLSLPILKNKLKKDTVDLNDMFTEFYNYSENNNIYFTGIYCMIFLSLFNIREKLDTVKSKMTEKLLAKLNNLYIEKFMFNETYKNHMP